MDGVHGLDRASSVTVSPDGGHVYVAAFSDDAVSVFSRDATTGELTFVQVLKDDVDGVDGLDVANSVTVSPDNGHVCVTAEIDESVSVFSRNTTTGELTFVQVLKDPVEGMRGSYLPGSATVSPDGDHMYVAAAEVPLIGPILGSVALFSRDVMTGELVFVQVLREGVDGVDGLEEAEALTISPDGNTSS